MKRDFSKITHSISKIVQPIKKQKISNTKWISATHLKNYMVNDTLVDWLKLHDKQRIGENNEQHNREHNEYQTYHNFPTNKKKSFSDFLMEQGIKFEAEIVKVLSKKVPIVFISDKITDDTCKETAKHIKNGTPVIHSAPVRNRKIILRGLLTLL